MRRIASVLLEKGFEVHLMGDTIPHGKARKTYPPHTRAMVYWSRHASDNERVRERVLKLRMGSVPSCTLTLEDSTGESITSRVPAYVKVEEGPDHIMGWMVESWTDLLKLSENFASGATRWARVTGEPL